MNACNQPLKPMMKKLLQSCALLGLCAGFATAAEPLIKNGSFEKPLNPWKVFSINDTPATDKAVADGVLTLTAADASDSPGNRQLMQEVKLEVGKTYTLSFDVKGSVEKGEKFPVVVTTGPGKYAYFNRIPLTAEWATKKLRITPKATDGTKPMALKFLFGEFKGEISIRKVSLDLVE